MSIQRDKLMNLADGKVLYDDLRERVEGKYTKPSGGIPASDLAAGVIPDISGKADDPTGTKSAGKVYGLDSNLNPVWAEQSGGTVTDVQVNGTSVLDGQGVANVPAASTQAMGAVIVGNGLYIASNKLTVANATGYIKSGEQTARFLTPSIQHSAAFYGLAKAAGSDEKDSTLPVGQYTDSAKSAISQMLNGAVSVSGSTPSITALAGVHYICGEVSTLDITLPASGCIDVTFTSGSTATVLTITPPTGVTVKWANGFDPTSLDANTTYEINIMDGLGVAASWT